MRLIGLIAMGFFLAVPAMAQTAGAPSSPLPSGTVHNFGSATCRQRVPCPDDPHTSAAAYAAGGNACMNEGFGYSSGSGYFDTEAGLDGNSCLTYLPGTFPKGAGAQLTPHCCVTKMPDNSCVFHCELNAYQ
jgi:hypothetical protein